MGPAKSSKPEVVDNGGACLGRGIGEGCRELVLSAPSGIFAGGWGLRCGSWEFVMGPFEVFEDLQGRLPRV